MHRRGPLTVLFLVVACALASTRIHADDTTSDSDTSTETTDESTTDATASSAADATAAAKGSSATAPEEYKPEEFPKWAWTLRRGESVFFGSLPFTLFAVTCGYETARYLTHINDSDASRYVPWPFRSSSAPDYTDAEAIGVGVGIVACSLAVAVVDYLIGELRGRRSGSR